MQKRLFCDFTEDVVGYLMLATHMCNQMTMILNLLTTKVCLLMRLILRTDSASNISCLKENHRPQTRAHSQLSRVSPTSSAKIKAEADKAALVERVAALKRKHSLEAKEEELRKEK